MVCYNPGVNKNPIEPELDMFEVDIRNRIRNIPLYLSNGLNPLYETILNSIDAIKDADLEPKDGLIEIVVSRNPEFTLEDGSSITGTFSCFQIIDNGVGFNERNFQSFLTSDSTYKIRSGGKGIGRFLWLKAYDKVQIDSVYQENGKKQQRSFNFSLASDDLISDLEVMDAPPDSERRTIVKLLDLKHEYEPSIPRQLSTIADRIIDHHLNYYILGRMPRVILYGSEFPDGIDLDQVFREFLKNSEGTVISIGPYKFDLQHCLVDPRRDLKHKLYLCARGMVVEDLSVAKKIPDLPSRIADLENESQLVYAAYATSEFLDDKVNQPRTGFDVARRGELVYGDDPTLEDIHEALLDSSKKFLEKFTGAVKKEKLERIDKFTTSEAPEFRYIVDHHPEALDVIPPDVSDTELSTHLFQIHHAIDGRIRSASSELLQTIANSKPEEVIDLLENEFEQFWSELNAVGKSHLAKYIVYRRLILKFFEEILEKQPSGKYELENQIHNLIFPTRKTSIDVPYDEHNLWIIDEKLAYHRFLASDIAQKKLGLSEELSRPDIIAFFYDQTYAYVDDDPPYKSIVIYEFKRPMRDDYTLEDNPVIQVLRYIRSIVNNEETTSKGRPIPYVENTPFYCYIICDITRTFRENYLEFQSDFIRMHDGQGYFSYNSKFHAYIEIISYQKLLSDAQKRNRVLFNKLQIDPDA